MFNTSKIMVVNFYIGAYFEVLWVHENPGDIIFLRVRLDLW